MVFKNRKHTPETIQKMRLKKIGKHHTEETKRKLSILKSGKNSPLGMERNFLKSIEKR